MYHVNYRDHILITVSISKKCNEILDQLSTTPITDLLFKTVLTKFVPSYRHPPTSNSTSKCSSAAVNQFSTPAPTPRWWTVNLSHLRHNVNIIIIVWNIQSKIFNIINDLAFHILLKYLHKSFRHSSNGFGEIVSEVGN